MEIDFAVLGIVLGFGGSSEAYLGPSEGVSKDGEAGGALSVPPLGQVTESAVRRLELYGEAKGY